MRKLTIEEARQVTGGAAGPSGGDCYSECMEAFGDLIGHEMADSICSSYCMLPIE